MWLIKLGWWLEDLLTKIDYAIFVGNPFRL